MTATHDHATPFLSASPTSTQDALPTRALERIRRAIRWSAVTDAEWPRDTFFVRGHLVASVLLAIATIVGLTHLTFSGSDQHPLLVGTWITMLFAIAGIAPLTPSSAKGRIITILRYDYVAMVSVFFVGPWVTLACALVAAVILALLYRPSGRKIRFWRSIVHWTGWIGGNVFVTVAAFALTYPLVGNWAFLIAGCASMVEEMLDRSVTFWAFGKFQCTWNCIMPAPHKLLIGPLGAFATVITPLAGGGIGAALLLAFWGLIATRIIEASGNLALRSFWQRRAISTLTQRIDMTADLLRRSTVPPKDAMDRLITTAEPFVTSFALSQLWIRLDDRGDGHPGVWAWEFDDQIKRTSQPVVALHRADPSPIAEAAFMHAVDKNPADIRGGLLVEFGNAETPMGQILFARQPNSFGLPFLAEVTAHSLGQAIAGLNHISTARNGLLHPETIVDDLTGALTFTAWHANASAHVQDAVSEGRPVAALAIRAPMPEEITAAYAALAIPGAMPNLRAINDTIVSHTMSALRATLASHASTCSNVSLGVDRTSGTCYALLPSFDATAFESLQRALSDYELNIPVNLPTANATITATTPMHWSVTATSMERHTIENLLRQCHASLADQQQPPKRATHHPSGIANPAADIPVTPGPTHHVDLFGFTQSPKDDLAAIIGQIDRGRTDALVTHYRAHLDHPDETPITLEAHLSLTDYPDLEMNNIWGLLGDDDDTLLRLWSHYVTHALSEASQWRKGLATRTLRPTLHLPQPLTHPRHRDTIWATLSSATQVTGVPLNDVLLFIADPTGLFDSNQPNFVTKIHQAGIRIITTNGAGLTHPVAHMFGDLIEWTVLDEEITRDAFARNPAVTAYIQDIVDEITHRGLTAGITMTPAGGNISSADLSAMKDNNVTATASTIQTLGQLLGTAGVSTTHARAS